MGIMQRFADKVRNELPDPGTTPLQHALHTLAAFTNSPDDEFVVMATSGVYETRTGLTWGDLRQLVAELDDGSDDDESDDNEALDYEDAACDGCGHFHGDGECYDPEQPCGDYRCCIN